MCTPTGHARLFGLGIKWESNAYNYFPQNLTRRTEPPTLNYETALDGTRQTGACGFLTSVCWPRNPRPQRSPIARCGPRNIDSFNPRLGNFSAPLFSQAL